MPIFIEGPAAVLLVALLGYVLWRGVVRSQRLETGRNRSYAEEFGVHLHQAPQSELNGRRKAGARRRASRPFEDEPTYHVDPEAESAAPRWDPFAPDQSRESRARATRKKARERTFVVEANNFYAMLGVDHFATFEEIDRAYRKKVARVHPDRFWDNPDKRAEAEKQTKQLNEAVKVLRDPDRRRRYDRDHGWY